MAAHFSRVSGGGNVAAHFSRVGGGCVAAHFSRARGGNVAAHFSRARRKGGVGTHFSRARGGVVAHFSRARGGGVGAHFSRARGGAVNFSWASPVSAQGQASNASRLAFVLSYDLLVNKMRSRGILEPSGGPKGSQHLYVYK